MAQDLCTEPSIEETLGMNNLFSKCFPPYSHSYQIPDSNLEAAHYSPTGAVGGQMPHPRASQRYNEGQALSLSPTVQGRMHAPMHQHTGYAIE